MAKGGEGRSQCVTRGRAVWEEAMASVKALGQHWASVLFEHKQQGQCNDSDEKRVEGMRQRGDWGFLLCGLEKYN